MGLPTKKSTYSRKKKRASRFALKRKFFNICPQCQKPIIPHQACSFCGYYKGRKVKEIRLTGKERQKEKDRKKKEKEKRKKK